MDWVFLLKIKYQIKDLAYEIGLSLFLRNELIQEYMILTHIYPQWLQDLNTYIQDFLII